ncbi:MAG TPA: HEPN domain-containing protein [bacterium]|nr:HEPN domain-containing protein [bacterium]
MPAENAPEVAAALLSKAKMDYGAMVAMRGQVAKLGPVIGFHAQQAVEKAVKAVMVTKGLRLKRTHDVAALWNELIAAGIEPPALQTAPEVLTRFAVEGRYVELLEEPDVESVGEELFLDVERVLTWAKSFIR